MIKGREGKCTICDMPALRSGLCHLHKWERYRSNVLGNVEKKRRILDEKIAQKIVWEKEQKLTATSKKMKRVEEIYKMYTEGGMVMEEIGAHYGVSRERIRQLLNFHPGWSTTKRHTSHE